VFVFAPGHRVAIADYCSKPSGIELGDRADISRREASTR
jgi:hypothetical protein